MNKLLLTNTWEEKELKVKQTIHTWKSKLVLGLVQSIPHKLNENSKTKNSRNGELVL